MAHMAHLLSQAGTYKSDTACIHTIVWQIHEHFVTKSGFKHPEASLKWSDRKESVEISKLGGKIHSLRLLEANYFSALLLK